MNSESDNTTNQYIENEVAPKKRTRNVTPVKYPLPLPYTNFEQHHISYNSEAYKSYSAGRNDRSQRSRWYLDGGSGSQQSFT